MSDKSRFAAISLLLILIALPPLWGSQAAAGEAALTKGASVEGITEYELSNGLRVLLFPDASKPTTTVNITYFVGSRHEGYGETGMAHLLEHLAFKGSPRHPNILQELTERGASPNGTTWFDRTNYFETFPASEENLDWALDLEADRMVNSFIAKKDLDSEMTVVRNEMEAGENSPFAILMQRTLSTAYLWHNYGNSTIGARSDVENVPIERLQAFYRKYYQPDNAMLVIAGQFDESRALELVVEEFGSIPRPERTGANIIYPTYTKEPTQDGERTVTLRRVGDTQLIMVSYHVAPGSHQDFAAVDLLSHALGDRPSGRLHKALVETGKASRAGAFVFQLKEAGPLILFAEVRQEDSLDDAGKTMLATLDALRDQPPTEEELNRARTARLRDIQVAFNNSERMALQLSEWASRGDWRLFFIHRDRIQQTSLEDLQRVASTYIKPQNRTIGYFIPTKEPERAEVPNAPDVAELVRDYEGFEAVAAGEMFDPTTENIESRTTRQESASGFQLALLPKETRGDAVVATFRINFGEESSLYNRWGVGELTAGMLMRGTTKRTRQEIADEIDRLQARVFLGGWVMSATGRIETTRENLPSVLELVSEVVREPRFDPSEFEQLKNEVLAGLESQKSEPGTLAFIEFDRHLSPWPKGHPRYNATIDEQIEEISRVTLDQVREFYSQMYGAGRGHMAIVGDFDPQAVAEIIEKTFGDWVAPSPTERVPTVYQDIPAKRIVVETPDKANAFFRAGMNIPVWDEHPDYPALVLGNFMIGGGFLNSRLAVRVRQQEGLSYHISSDLFGHPEDKTGQFTAFAIFAPENAERLEEAFREELERVLEDGFTAEEVEKAKRGYLDSQGVARARDMALANMLSQHLYFGRTMEWDETLERKIEALTPEEVHQALRRHIDLSKISVVLAGDFAKK